MIYTIVPAKNEEARIHRTLNMLLKTNTDRILVLINGSTDNTLKRALDIDDSKIEIYCFNKPLGFDIPRSLGAYFAYNLGASSFVFVDGDMIGDIYENINEIISDLHCSGIDMGLTDCYPKTDTESNIAKMLLSFRRQLNLELGIYHKIGSAIPSHGPHGVSRRLIEKIGFDCLAVPPVSLALAVKNKLNIRVSTEIPNFLLKSKTKDEFHALQIAKTIIGDCIEASSAYHNNERKRGFDDIDFLGYHKNRRFDILKLIMENSN